MLFFLPFLLLGTLYGHADFFDLKQQGYEQYQDIYVQGQVIQKASFGERYLEERFERINRIFSRYKRPFTVLDVGGAQGYFTFRGADLYPKSVFVMLEGSNAVYPTISKQVASICHLNRHMNNVIWLDRPIVVEELHQLSFCEHVDVALLLNILHWFPKTWKTLIDAMRRMSHVTIVELPPLEEGLPSDQIELRSELHAYLREIAEEIWEGVPRHTNPSIKTVYYIIESKEPFYLQTTTLIHPAFGDRRHRIDFDYETKQFTKEELFPPYEKTTSPWIPGINLITYLMGNGAFPLRSELVRLLPIDTEHRDWMPNNMIVQGKKIILIDKGDPKNKPGGVGSSSLCDPEKKRALEKLLLTTQNASPQDVKKAFENFCKQGRS